ncbi:MAG: hypothetical protein K0R61_3673 [Microvirga sp.]|jgi:hypothetical protein|nr:hypothetical protein [Microvirga sp.]
MPKPDKPGEPKHHKVVMNYPAATWAALEDQADAEGLEPKELIRRFVNEGLGLDEEPDGLDDDDEAA